jgi:hypothetical protein
MAPQRAFMRPLRRWDPERIDGYVLLGRLGSGAMGQVYLGRSAAGRLVAVKTIKIELAEEPDFRNRFAQEVAAARRVSGAFTAAVVAADPEADLPWLATSYVPAPSLRALIKAGGPLPGPAVRWLGAGCAEALESIHSAGLVHRDLKPSNVLVSPDGPRVIDFGIARAAERIQLTVTRGAVGTPAYMAPEQARDTRHATMASDIFSLGATMLFAATGHAPYQGETVMDVLVRLATEPPDLSGLPADLTEIVSACLHRDPRRRPDSAAILAHLVPGTALADITQPGPAPRSLGAGAHPAGSMAPAPESPAGAGPGPAGPGPAVLGPSALPAAALAMIDGYRQDPLPLTAGASGPSGPAGVTGGTDDDTFGSHTGASHSDPGSGWPTDEDGPGGGRRDRALQDRRADGPEVPRPHPGGGAGPGRPAAGHHSGPGHDGTLGSGRPAAGHPPLRRVLVIAAAVIAIIAASGAAGAAIAASQTTASQTTASQTTAGSSPAAQVPQPPPGGAPPTGPPPTGLPSPPVAPGGITKPTIGLSQGTGDGLTSFVISGYAWPAEQPVTIKVAGATQSTAQQTTDAAGTFHYTINQDHRFFRGAIPTGLYQVTVTARGGKHATASFRVDPVPSPAAPTPSA